MIYTKPNILVKYVWDGHNLDVQFKRPLTDILISDWQELKKLCWQMGYCMIQWILSNGDGLQRVPSLLQKL